MRKRVRRDSREPERQSGADDFDSDIMTLREVADYLHCHFITVYRLIKTEGLRAFRLGSDWRFRRADLEMWIARQRVQAGGSRQPKGREPTVARAKKPPLRKKRSRG